MEWQADDAANRLDEILDEALSHGPQRIRQQNGPDYIVLAASEYERLIGRQPGFTEFLLNAPDFSELDLERDRQPMRDIDL